MKLFEKLLAISLYRIDRLEDSYLVVFQISIILEVLIRAGDARTRYITRITLSEAH